jgi:hypothetical protein
MADVERSPEEIARIKEEVAKQRAEKAEAKKARDRERKAKAKEAQTGVKVATSSVSKVKAKETAKVEAAGAESRAESALPEHLSTISKQIKASAESDRETLGRAKDVSLGLGGGDGGVVANIDTSADDGQNTAMNTDTRGVGRGQTAGGYSAEDLDNMHQTASLFSQFVERKLNVQPTSSSIALQHAADLIDDHASTMGENTLTQKVHAHIEKAQWHIDQHEAAHNDGDHEAALGHITKAADHIRQAAKGFGEGFRIQSPIGKVRPSNWTDSAVLQYSKEHGVGKPAEVKGPSKTDLTLGQDYAAPLTAGESGRQAQIDAGETIGSTVARSNKRVGEGWVDKEVEKAYNKKPVPKSVEEEDQGETAKKELSGGVNTSTRIRLATGGLKPEEAAGVKHWQESFAPESWMTSEGVEQHRQRLEGLLSERITALRGRRAAGFERVEGDVRPNEAPRLPRVMKEDENGALVYTRALGPEEAPGSGRHVRQARAEVGVGPLPAYPYARDAFEKEHGHRPSSGDIPVNYERLSEQDKAPFKPLVEKQQAWDTANREKLIKPGADAYLASRNSEFGKGQVK